MPAGKTVPLFSGKQPMRVAVLMSGSGSNLVTILEHPACGKEYTITCILTDNPQSNAKNIAKRFSIPYEKNDITAFYSKIGKPRSDLSARPQFDGVSVAKLAYYKPDVVAYCGYMSIASPTLVNAFLGVNVHPADLRLQDNKGRRKFVGAHAVRDAILAGQKELRSTTHIVSDEADQGAILMVSKPVKVILPKKFDRNNAAQVAAVVRENQERLKQEGDWKVFPETLQAIAQGRFSKGEKGLVFCDDKPVPKGVESLS